MFNFEKFNIPDNLSLDDKIIEEICINLEKTAEEKQKWTVNIVFVWEEEIRELNKNYRKKDYITDVLSFHYFDDFSSLERDDIAWEILLCKEKIEEQAKEFNLTLEEETYKLLIHSFLHLLWYDHETDEDYKIMKPKEDKMSIEIFWKIL